MLIKIPAHLLMTKTGALTAFLAVVAGSLLFLGTSAGVSYADHGAEASHDSILS